MTCACLVDLTKCIGCRACQVACKQKNGNDAEKTEFFSKAGGYQNPADLSARTFTLVSFTEVKKNDGELEWVFAKRQCMHCIDPSCVSACIVGALVKTPEGPVIYDSNKCIGCRYCMIACPFSVPSFEWHKTIPFIKKCNFCFDRQVAREPVTEVNGKPISRDASSRLAKSFGTPACAKACPTGALSFGERDTLVKEAKRRISDFPERYEKHIYGENEVGGTSWLYLSSVSFDRIGFPDNLGDRPFPSYSHTAKAAVPPLILGVGSVFAGLFLFSQRRTRVENENTEE